MLTALSIVSGIAIVCFLSFILNRLSYKVLKNRIVRSGSWDLNVCCGHTDCGGVNTDIVAHSRLPNQVLADPFHLPFKDKTFHRVLCSHAAEHVHDPDALLRELRRVGHEVTVIVPPLWDLSVFFNVLEHRWIFLTFSKVFRNELPPYVRLPMASLVQETIGQRIKA